MTKGEEHPGASDTETVNLQGAELNCERALLYLLRSPHFEVHHPEVGSHVRQEVDMSITEWLDVTNELLKNVGAISLKKSDENQTRPDIMALNLHALEQTNTPYITHRLASIMRERIMEEFTIREISELPHVSLLDLPEPPDPELMPAPIDETMESAKPAKKKRTTRQNPEGSRHRRRESVGYRMAEVLIELDQAGGTMEFPSLSTEIRNRVRNRAERSGGTDTYKKTIANIVNRGLAEYYVTENGQKITLTETGRFFVERLKEHPELISKKQEGRSRPVMGNIVKHLGKNVDYEDKDGNKWLYPPNYPDAIMAALAEELEMPEKALTRRVYEGRVGFGYFVTENGPSISGGRGAISNIGLTKDGLEYYEKLLLAEEPKEEADEELLDSEAIDEVDAMIQTCLELAAELGAQDVINELRARRDAINFSITTHEEFEFESRRIIHLLGELRRSYVEQVRAARQNAA
jgi:hypothetical protein